MDFLELIFTLICLPLVSASYCYYSGYSGYYCYYYSYSSAGVYAGATFGAFVVIVIIVVVVVCIAKQNQRNRVIAMHGGGATVTNVNNVNTIHHPPAYGYGAPPSGYAQPQGFGPPPGYAQPGQSTFGGGDPAYPPMANQYPPPKY